MRLAEVWVDNEYPGEELGLVDRRLQLVSWLSSPATLAGRISARRLPACWRLASSSGLTMLRLTMRLALGTMLGTPRAVRLRLRARAHKSSWLITPPGLLCRRVDLG